MDGGQNEQLSRGKHVKEGHNEREQTAVLLWQDRGNYSSWNTRISLPEQAGKFV